MTNGAANLASIKLVFGRNSVDQPIYPRRGSEFSASVQATLPYSLWDGKDYKNWSRSPTVPTRPPQRRTGPNQERYRWVEFHKWQFKAQWFQVVPRNSNLVLMLKAEMGYLGSYNKYKVSPFERYEVGGDGMSGYNIYGIDIIAMRGYEDGALDPGSNYSRGYNKYTAELRYPIILKPSSQIYVLGFLEGGNAFDFVEEVLALQDQAFGRFRRPPLPPRGGYARYRLGLRIRRSGELLDQERQPVPLRSGTTILA